MYLSFITIISFTQTERTTSLIMELLFVSAILFASNNFAYSYVVVNKLDPVECVLDKRLKNEIASYQPVVDRIVGYSRHGYFKYRTYSE